MAPLAEAQTSPLNSLTSSIFTLSNRLTRSLINTRSVEIDSRSLTLYPRDSGYVKGGGVTPPQDIPNNAVFAIFGLIGAGFVITGIWFFFWAKNGGFHFKETDWEDYKSTVLRRKGPNGTTLSNATRSTDLGGGSIVGRKQRMARYKDVDVESSIGTQSEMSEIKAGRGGRHKRDGHKKHRNSRTVGTESLPADEESVVSGVVEEDLEPEDVVRAYRHEKPARVGGINRVPDGSAFEGSTHDSQSGLLSNREHTPTNTPTKTPTKKVRKDNYTGGSGSPGIRKVDSTSDGHSGFWGSKKQSEPEKEDRIKSEARKLQEKGRAAGGGRRDFSYTAGDDAVSSITASTADEERRARRQSRQAKVPGSYAESGVGSDAGSEATGTKAYHHPIPGLSDYAEERRRAREKAGGYRRGE